mmetsp:Transcript_41937/g.64203  ORF Transcript_41937/g.64203 Transcript_41937/m.64203 type:complete len:128 (+) Transcript_41937:1836-2219(+)
MHQLHGSTESAILSVEDQKLDQLEEEKEGHRRQGSIPFNDTEDYNLTCSIDNPSEPRLVFRPERPERSSMRKMQKQIIMANLARAKHNTFLLPPPTESSVHPDETVVTKEEEPYGEQPLQQEGHSTT